MLISHDIFFGLERKNRGEKKMSERWEIFITDEKLSNDMG